MKTARGTTMSSLLAVTVEQGTLTCNVSVPMSVGDITKDAIEKMIPLINERITTERKPGATFEKELARIEHHRSQMRDAYVALFECYQRMVTPATRTSPTDKAMVDMLTMMPDKMLRDFCTLHVGSDKAMSFVLPDERDELIDVTVAAMRDKKNGTTSD